MWLIFTITTADNLTFFHCKRFEFTCDVKSFLDTNSNHSLSPSPLFVQTALFSFHHDKNAPTTTMSAISPPLHRFQRWKHRLPSTLISAHRPLRPHHLSSHQVRAITRRLRNRLRSNPRVRWDGTAAAVNLTAAPASHTSPHSSTVLKLQLMPLERKKWWVQQSAIVMLCLFDEC